MPFDLYLILKLSDYLVNFYYVMVFFEMRLFSTYFEMLRTKCLFK